MAGLSGAASRPTSSVPARPPIRCTPTTSSESSKPSLNFSPTASAHSTPATVAIVVVMNVAPAAPLELVAEPALNPYQPNHSKPAPSITNGTLCGRNSVVGQPLGLPSTIARTKPATPELIWTAVPPAKSIACSLLAIQPPCSDANPSNAKTQCATGK